jgi:hypothetical protein
MAIAKFAEKMPPPAMIVSYATFIGAGIVLFQMAMGGTQALSAIITLAEMLQCLAVILLAAQVLASGSVCGISARTVGLEGLALACKLVSTLNYNGYLPVDESGDWFYQSLELSALAAALWLLYQCLVTKKSSYQHFDDTFPVAPIIFICFALASLLHADLNLRPFYDTFWMAGLFIGSVAVMPQLWLILRSGSHVETLMSHYIFAMMMGRMLSGYFMWIAREDVTCKPWIEGVSHAIIAILGAHLLNLVLLGDFAYYYLKALATQGLNCKLELHDVTYYV